MGRNGLLDGLGLCEKGLLDGVGLCENGLLDGVGLCEKGLLEGLWLVDWTGGLDGVGFWADKKGILDGPGLWNVDCDGENDLVGWGDAVVLWLGEKD